MTRHDLPQPRTTRYYTPPKPAHQSWRINAWTVALGLVWIGLVVWVVDLMAR